MSPMSLEFAAFVAVAFALNYIMRSAKWQNLCLLIASLAFYFLCAPKSLPLLLVSVATYYVLGIAIDNGTLRERRLITALSVCLGAGLLAWFKFAGLLFPSSSIVMPVGLSFYTFRLIAYPIEVSRGTLKALRSPIDFALYATFFPTILSGPIDRPNDFLPQISKRRAFSYERAVLGSKQIVWGLFLKLCIADRLAPWVQTVDAQFEQYTGTTSLVAMLLYPVQLYTDFAGYSLVAIGVAGLLNIKVADNFRRPFFARNISDFWNRWHMSLMQWLRHYVYFPLGGSRCSKAKVLRNTVIVWAVSGIWHGQGWTFIVWGMYHAMLFLPLIFGLVKRRPTHGISLVALVQVAITYVVTSIGWHIFRAASLAKAWEQLRHMLTNWGRPAIEAIGLHAKFILPPLVVWLASEIYCEWIAERLPVMRYRLVRWVALWCLLWMIYNYIVTEQAAFIYVQF